MLLKCSQGQPGRRHITCEGEMYYRDGNLYCATHYRAQFALNFDQASDYLAKP